MFVFVICSIGGSARGTELPDTCIVRGTVVDAETEEPIPARVHVRSRQGTWYLVKSDGGQHVHYERRRPQTPRSQEVHTTLSSDPFVVELQPGQYTFRIERGKEYLPVEQLLDIRESRQRTFRLRRWINMADDHWYSGDTHVHRSLEELPNVMLAEELNVALPLTYWVRRAATPPSIDGRGASPEPKPIIVDATHVIYPINTEYEIFNVGNRSHTLGAVFALNHRSALPMGTPPVRAVARAARQQGALLDLDKHNWPWSLMIVPIMDVDLFELSNNHIWQTEFGFPGWYDNLAPEYMNLERQTDGLTEWGWIDFGFQTYYALLNCGFRLRVSAGTASGVHPVQLGFSRVYVHLPDGFSYARWIEGLDRGRSFVTTGPMLQVTFNEQDPGHRFTSPAGDERFCLKIAGLASSARPLDRIEIIVNGQVEQTMTPQNSPTKAGGYETHIDATVSRDATHWVALRCFETTKGDRVRFAHTNPIFVDIANRPLHPRREEIEYLIQRMKEEIARNQDVLSADALTEYKEALSIYERIAESAR
jgi:hypothetical protein